jgi:hypothetical protein
MVFSAMSRNSAGTSSFGSIMPSSSGSNESYHIFRNGVSVCSNRRRDYRPVEACLPDSPWSRSDLKVAASAFLIVDGRGAPASQRYLQLLVRRAPVTVFLSEGLILVKAEE